MAPRLALRLPLLIATNIVIVALTGSLVTSPAFSQGSVLEVITKIIQEQHELAERRRAQIAAIKRMQFGLKQLGYYHDRIDGDFGPETSAALGAYRRSMGRPNSGLLSIEEVEEIENRAGEELAAPPQPQLPSSPGVRFAEARTLENFIRADTPPRLDAKLPRAAAWIIIASRPTPEEAKEIAEEYLHWFPSTTVTHSSNGVFAISIGWLTRERGGPLKDALISRKLIPPDSFLSSGEKLEPPIWSADGARIHSRNDLLLYALVRTSPELMSELPNTSSGGFVGFNSQVSGLTDPASDYLSLRTGSSTSSKELRRLPASTRLKILRTKGEWNRVELLNGMSGWVSAKYVSRDVTGGKSEPEPRPDMDKGPVVSPEKRMRDRQIIEAATTFLDDLVVYLKLHPETPNIASIAQEVSEIQQAVADEDVPSIEATSKRLKSAMKEIPDFPEWVKKREEERTTIKIQALGQATTLASKHKRFLRKQIAENITSPNTPELAVFLKQYESALQTPDLSTLTDLNDRLKKFISEKGLTPAYDAAIAEREPEAKPEQEPGAKPEPKKPEITSKNKFLLKGDLSDWVLLFNASGNAPHVARNIRGDIVFEDRQADACVLHPISGKVEAAQVEDILSDYNVETVRLSGSPCQETELASQDVLIANRGELLKRPPSYLAALLGSVEDGTFEELVTLSSDQFERSEKFCELKATEIENKIRTGVEGFGLVKIDNGSPNICVTTAEQEEAHRALLNDQRKTLLRCFNSAPKIQSTTIGTGFIDAKRGKCGAIYANRLDLAEAIESFRRDNVRFSVVSMWFDSNMVQARADEIGREKERRDEQERDWKHQKEIDDEKRREREKDKLVQEHELRDQHGSMARAKVEEIEDAVKLLVDDKPTWADTKFTKLTSWYRSQRGWEVDAVGFDDRDEEVVDYGTADWETRRLEAAFTNVRIWMRNNFLGKKMSKCFTLGVIFDTEFQNQKRAPFEEDCEKALGPARDWKKRRQFRSQWVVE